MLKSNKRNRVPVLTIMASTNDYLRCLALTLFAILYPSGSLGIQKCVPLQKGPFSKCSLAGYNYTFPLPSGLSKRSLMYIKSSVNYYMSSIQNCSAGAIGETMACAFLAPYCRESSFKPLLPCKRVCSEFLKRCEGSLPDFVVDILIGLCSVLPNATASDGTCYEPVNFHFHYNSTRKGPLERSCSPVIIPICQNIGYTHTILTHERQLTLYNRWYLKNYTKSSSASIPHPNSGAQRLINLTKKFNRCGVNVKKLFCAEYIPPCFEQEGIAYYTACQDVCKNVTVECPEVLRSRMRFFLYCEKLAFGDPYKGFCKHRSWPPPMKWLDIFKDRKRRPNKPPKPSGVGGGAVAAIIVVPVIIVGTIIAMVYLYKKRKLTSRGYARQQDDNVELVT